MICLYHCCHLWPFVIFAAGNEPDHGPEVQTIDSKFPIATMFDGFVTVPMAKVVSLLLAAGFAAIIVVFMKKAAQGRLFGRPLRTHVQPVYSASILTVFTLTFSLNAAICKVAGVLVSILGFGTFLRHRLLLRTFVRYSCWAW